MTAGIGAASVSFSRAIVRAPAESAVNGLRAVDTGAPDLALLRRQHAAYVAALRAAGLEVTDLPPLPAFPDAQFVEDTALCLPAGAIVMRPGAPSRLGEAAEMAPVLAAFYDRVETLREGHAEGGDILVTGREILVGLSARTDRAGLAEVTRIADHWGYPVRAVQTPPGILHFKTDCALLEPETILATGRLAAGGTFDGYRVIRVPDGEEAAANAIRVNGRVLLPEGFPRTQDMLARAGFDVQALGNSECARLDGGMSCLSLRFTPPG